MFMFKSRPSGFVGENNIQMQSCYLNQWYPGQVGGSYFLYELGCLVYDRGILGSRRDQLCSGYALWQACLHLNATEEGQESTK